MDNKRQGCGYDLHRSGQCCRTRRHGLAGLDGLWPSIPPLYPINNCRGWRLNHRAVRRCYLWLVRSACMLVFVTYSLQGRDAFAAAAASEPIEAHSSLTSLVTTLNDDGVLDRAKQLRVFSQQSNLEAGNSIYQAILQAALAEDAKMFGPTQIRDVPPPIRQDFAYQLLSEGGADIHHAGTSIWLEQQLRPVKVPLLGGGLGWRGMLVSVHRQQAIKQITQFSQLQHLTACQGSDWPDTQVLRAAGLKVWTADTYDALIQALRDGRCDYFPRSLFEGYAEVRALQLLYPDLRFESKILLQYPYATYFFVRPEHTHWQLRLTLALQRLAHRGELARLWQQHPATSAVFPLQQYQSSLVFQLVNPAVASSLPTEPYLWLQFPAQTRLIAVDVPQAQ